MELTELFFKKKPQDPKESVTELLIKKQKILVKQAEAFIKELKDISETLEELQNKMDGDERKKARNLMIDMRLAKLRMEGALEIFKKKGFVDRP